jgi:hypothetical protein
MASSYIAARAMAGGKLVTALVHNSSSYLVDENMLVEEIKEDEARKEMLEHMKAWLSCIGAPGAKGFCQTASKTELIHKVGPLLNPSISFGYMLTKGNFTSF